jgi:flagellar protein FliJ
MSKLKSIALAIEVATRRRDEASKALVELQRALGFANNQMEQLASYARDSESRWMASAQVSAMPEMMLHHYQFMDRLEQAIKMQQGVIADQGLSVERARQVVLQAEFRLASLNRVMQSRVAEMNARATRQEQREMDDLAALMHRARLTSIHVGDQI